MRAGEDVLNKQVDETFCSLITKTNPEQMANARQNEIDIHKLTESEKTSTPCCAITLLLLRCNSVYIFKISLIWPDVSLAWLPNTGETFSPFPHGKEHKRGAITWARHADGWTDGKRQKRVKLTGNWQCPMEPFTASELQRSIWIGPNLLGETHPQWTQRDLTYYTISMSNVMSTVQNKASVYQGMNSSGQSNEACQAHVLSYSSTQDEIYFAWRNCKIYSIWQSHETAYFSLMVINAMIKQAQALQSSFSFPKNSKSEVLIISESITAELKLDICLVYQALPPA